MQFEAKSAAPQPAQMELRQPALNRAVEGSITLFTAPSGYLMTECLAPVLAEQGRRTVWLRLGPEDHDHATFLTSLIDAARRAYPESGATTLDQMRRRPGPIAGWAPLFAELGQELAGAFAASTVVVIEHIHYLNSGSPALEMLGAHLLPALASHSTCILTSQQLLPSTALPAQTKHQNAADLRLDDKVALALADHTQANLTSRCVHNATLLTEGRARALVSLCNTSAALGQKLVEQAVCHASNLNECLGSHLWLQRELCAALCRLCPRDR